MLNVDAQRLETLIEINELINTDFQDSRSLLTRILESATRLTGGEASSLLLLDPVNRKLYFEIALGSKGPEMKRFSLDLGEGIAGWVAQHNRSLIVNDVENDKRFFAPISKTIGFKTDSILAVPMRLREQCIGVIEIVNRKEGNAFSQDDLQWLEVFANQAALAIQNAKEYQKLLEEVHQLRHKVDDSTEFHHFVGTSNLIREKLELARRIGATESSVLLIGESGSGKELFAERIHLESMRREKPFIRVNCAALPEHLLESELFGHVKGAFTDASKERIGRFELADGGTIFLDEVGELPLSVQAKLLRVIQHQVFEKVGSSEPCRVDTRIIAATNRNLEEAMDKGLFRQDLYYRLNVLPFVVPPLRDRPEDIPVLADYFFRKTKRELGRTVSGFSAEAMDALLSYRWPGNVRELENVVERAIVISTHELIRPEDLMLPGSSSLTPDAYAGSSLKEAVLQFKRHFITKALEEHNWNQTDTAKAVGIQRTYLSKLIKELEISR
ncbi:sigma-54-dependent Fis family transcriptional regulator [Sediminispirochaeta smaragdinae]|uniref:Transcriptional regulator, NifA subfamily, Fis Family n=1 Tax=Sediminispirochaeta smaragdinae (strain DSM 11293 / JCM 15392 / SEBR 4228) TaxID=573413 RepID=E1R2Z3_SEDSS|nr:sigma 54-interacting transcriptional regulator [Sediminispirochaeta smaragdinae]ADK81179.1 transcriptional regulator, NifA subfamily, Fis Family [Sediminispirochaeta smaragdinae DSM 11293]